MNKREGFWIAVIVSIGVLYVSLRLWNLTESCLWFDEIFGIHAAEQDWANLFWFVAQDLIHPPLFYVLLKIWIQIGGESLFWLRLFPVAFSTAALVPFYLFCRRLKLNFSTIALAFSFFAVNGALVKYAQEIRMYAVLLCLSLVSLWLFSRFFNLGKSFTLLIIVNVLLVYTHYFGWLVVLSEICAVAVFQRVKIRQILIMSAIVLLGFAPWIFAVWSASRINADFSQNLGWASRPNLPVVFGFLLDLIEPFYFQQTNVDKTSVFLVTVPFLLLLIAVGIFYLFNRKNESETDNRKIYLLLIFALFPVIAALTASYALPVSVWGTRHLIICFAPCSIFIAVLIDKIGVLYLKLAILGLLFWLTGIAFLIRLQSGAPPLINCAWAKMAKDLESTEAKSGERAKIFVFEDLIAYDFWFALRENADKFQIVKINGVSGLAEDAAYFLPRGFDAVEKREENALRGDRIFIAFRDAEWNEAKPPLRNLRANNYKLVLRKTIQAQGVKAFLVEAEKIDDQSKLITDGQQ